MSDIVLTLAPDLPGEDRDAVRRSAGRAAWLPPLSRQVADLLGVAPAAIVVRVIAAPPYTARTRLPAADGRRVIEISPDCLTLPVLAHEICHALVPTRWLLVAEGLAFWVANRVSGDCGLLFFDAPDYHTVVARNWPDVPAPSDLADESVAASRWLGPDGLISATGRLANAVAASFCGFCLERWPGFAAAAVRLDAGGPRQGFPAATGLSFASAELLWRTAMASQAPC